jgi:phospholipid/cholesterol/gamma-HCH transport system permease protein
MAGFSRAARAIRLLGACIAQLTQLPWRGREIVRLTTEMGVESFPIIGLATAAAGLVTTNEMAWHMNVALHDNSMIPGFSGQFIFRELGVVVPAFLIISKVGASLTAEIAVMKGTEQLDALKMLKISTLQYLIFPRWVASILSVICLTLLSLSVTLAFAMLTAVLKLNFNVAEYLTTLQKFLGARDVIGAIVKSAAFGAVIPIISCIYGMESDGGAQGVGEATTQSVVTSTLAVIVLDFVLTWLIG